MIQTQALVELSVRLDDYGCQYWRLFELRAYLKEALRVWNCYTSWYRQRAVMNNLATGSLWYDLRYSLAPGLMEPTVTDIDIADMICYHLLEEVIQLVDFNGEWEGTEQFNLNQVQSAIQHRLDRFLGDTGIVLNYFLQNSGIPSPDGRALIPPSIIDVRRVSWVDTGFVNHVLWRANEWEMNAYRFGWQQNPEMPQVYSQSVTRPASIQIAPPPDAGGLLEILGVTQGPVLDMTHQRTVLTVPDDFAWGIKWGALADLLNADGQCKDATRAAYCEQRYQECVGLALAFPAILGAQINDVPVFMNSVFEMDSFDNGWQNKPAGDTTQIATAGRNLIALSPAPAGGTSVTFDVVANMPVPATDADYLQLPPDVIDAVIGYAQHLASFKMGGNEFMASDPLRQNLLLLAAEYNGRLRQLDFYNDAIRQPSQKQEAQVTRLNVPNLTGFTIPTAPQGVTQ